MEFDRYLTYLEARLTPGRLTHSLGVMQVMGELAEIYGFEREQGRSAGLLHDAAKDLAPAEVAEYAARANVTFHHDCETDYTLYQHGPLGAYLARVELGVTYEAILEAINTHTWQPGRGFDAPLSWCLRFADVLEPNRDWSKARWLKRGAPGIREAAYGGRLAEAALLHSGILVRWFSEDGYPVHPNMHRVYAERKFELGLDDSLVEGLV